MIFGGILAVALLHPFFIVFTGYAITQQLAGATDDWFAHPLLQFSNFFIFFSGYFFAMLAGAYALENADIMHS